ncbi:MAG: hypothetical protein JO112_01905 [Planctomycetes bacterium]|nr:hypothetical protein [Planctomycetota bacterium]
MSDNDTLNIFLTLYVAEAQVLYVTLSADGTIHRMGTGSEYNEEFDLFIGRSTRNMFDCLSSQVTPGLLQWVGEYTDQHLKGKHCRLTIGIRQANGKEMISRWEYGTLSQSPPPEICEFVLAAIKVTDPWYELQKQHANPRKKIGREREERE